MRKLAYGALALVFVVSCVGLAAAQTDDIDDLHVYDTDGTNISPYLDTQVSVEGRIFVVRGTYNGGTHYILDDNGNGISFYLSTAPPLVEGDRVQVDGYLNDYNGESQISDNFGGYPAPVVSFLGNEAAPTPEVMTIAEVIHGVGGEDGYENIGKFVDVTGTVATAPGTDYNHSFNLHNGLGDTLVVFIDGTTGIDDTGVEIGDTYRIISPVVKYNELIELKPRSNADLIEGSGPVIDDIECDDWSPLSNEDIVVSAMITDETAVLSATLYFRDDDGDSTGTFNSTPMVDMGGDTWTATISAPHTERQVDFYVEASDGITTSSNPASAPDAWHEVAIGFTPIYDVQYRDPSSELQGSDYYNRTVNLSGIVMVGTGDTGAASQFIMADDVGAFNSILVYESTAAGFYLAGDGVEVGGYIDEYFGLTEMAPHSPSAVELVSFSNDLYPAVAVDVGILSDNTLEDGDDVFGEAYESVWVTTFCSTVTDTTGYDQYSTFLISDSPGDTLTVDAEVDLITMIMPGDNLRTYGFMDYSYGNFEIVPLQDEDITMDCSTAVGDELPQLAPAGGFTRIAPNPFNPKTEIRFVLARDIMTQLNIYNIRGELVRNLASELLETGEHIRYWDGRDLNGQRVSSGTYFARLRLGSEVLQMQKLMLLK